MGKIAFEYINPDYKKRISGKLVLAVASSIEMPVYEPKKDSVVVAKAVAEMPKTVVTSYQKPDLSS